MKKWTKNLLIGAIGLSSIFSLKNDSMNFLEKICWKNHPQQKEIILKAKNELEKNGITSEQKEGYGIFSERAYLTVRPSVYDAPNYLRDQTKNFIFGKNRFKEPEKLREEYSLHSEKLRKYDKEGNFDKIKKELDELDKIDKSMDNYCGEDDPYSEDGWRMYLGLPMKNNTFRISNYVPSKSKEKNTYYYKLPKEFEEELLQIITKEEIEIGKFTEFVFKGVFGENISRARVLGNFRVEKGKDTKGNYVSYYDIYDFSPNLPLIGKIPLDTFIGKPFEIYNRIYYNPQTGEILK